MKTTLRMLAVTMLIALAALGCKREQKAGGAASTETISPATPQPEQTGTGDLTQTVDIEDSRSEAEGAALTDPDHATTGTTATTATTTTTGTTATAPPTTTTR